MTTVSIFNDAVIFEDTDCVFNYYRHRAPLDLPCQNADVVRATASIHTFHGSKFIKSIEVSDNVLDKINELAHLPWDEFLANVMKLV